MPLLRCSDQNYITLEEFYTEKSKEEYSSNIGESMLKVISLIDKTFPETKIYGLTSLYQLKLLAFDSYQTPWFVSIISGGPKEFFIEYLIPKEKQPWPDTIVRGEANSYENAMKCLIIAMKESGGWENSQELKKLYSDLAVGDK